MIYPIFRATAPALAVLALALLPAPLLAQTSTPATSPGRPPSSPAAFRGAHAENFASRPESFFASADGQKIADNVLTWQTPRGAWSKNYDPTHPHVEGAPFGEWETVDTIDNGATYSELRILAKANAAKANPAYTAAFLKGFDKLLEAQYDNGGWPQRFPDSPEPYGRHITYNDNAMTEVMIFLKEILDNHPQYAFIDADRRAKAKTAFDKGLDCILKCQIVVDGKPTGWCAQHDEKTLAPAKARAYELPSFSGSEGASLAVFLMSLPHPDDRTKAAIRGAAAWFDKVKLTGIRVGSETGPDGRPNRVVVQDPAAPPLWARFYDLDTQKPFFCGRDGIKKSSMADIEAERRNGYAWYGNWGNAVATRFAQWQKENPQ
jgi:pectinesterase